MKIADDQFVVHHRITGDFKDLIFGMTRRQDVRRIARSRPLLFSLGKEASISMVSTGVRLSGGWLAMNRSSAIRGRRIGNHDGVVPHRCSEKAPVMVSTSKTEDTTILGLTLSIKLSTGMNAFGLSTSIRCRDHQRAHAINRQGLQL